MIVGLILELRSGRDIEFLCDVDGLSDHCNRFKPQGSYYRWIEQGLIKDWLILDSHSSSY